MQSRFKYLSEKINSNSEKILISLLILFYLTEGTTKLGLFSNLNTISLQAGVKLMVLILVVFGLILYKKKQLLFISILILFFCIGQLFLQIKFDIPILIYCTKYIFPIAMYGFFTIQSQSPKITLLNTFEYILLFNSVLIILGLIFEITSFNTYVGNRFGYSGLLVASSTSTYFYIIGLSCFFMRYRNKVIKNWKFWIVAFSALLVGTKSLVFGLILLIFIYTLNHRLSKKYWITLIFGIIISFGFSYYLFFINPLFKSLIETHGFITSFLSLRDQLLIAYTLPFIFENWTLWNYFFGGTSNFEIRPQMEFLDTLFFWGIIGGISYIIFYYKSFFNNQPFFNMSIKSYLIICTLLLICMIAFISGNFFYNSSVVIYMLILRENIVYSSVVRRSVENMVIK